MWTVCLVSTTRPRAVRGPGRCGPRCQNSANAAGTPSIAAARHAPSSCRNRTPKLASQIGHMKAEGHLGRCYLKGRAGDAANVILSAVGYNLRLVLAWLSIILRVILLALL